MLNTGQHINSTQAHCTNIFSPYSINARILERLWFYIFNKDYNIKKDFI
jgi:hypothetical protein